MEQDFFMVSDQKRFAIFNSFSVSSLKSSDDYQEGARVYSNSEVKNNFTFGNLLCVI